MERVQDDDDDDSMLMLAPTTSKKIDLTMSFGEDLEVAMQAPAVKTRLG